MKKLLTPPLFALLCGPIANAQSLAYAGYPGFSEIIRTSNDLPVYGGKREQAKKVMAAGGIGMGLGGTLVVAGAVVIFGASGIAHPGTPAAQAALEEQQRKQRIAGQDMMIGGAGLFVVGTTLLICGGISRHEHRWSLVAPKSNEFGLAYSLTGHK